MSRSLPTHPNPCYGLTPTIVVNGGVTNGTSKPDVIMSDSSNNTIYLGAGDDMICIYGENNVIYGGRGNDTLYLPGS